MLNAASRWRNTFVSRAVAVLFQGGPSNVDISTPVMRIVQASALWIHAAHAPSCSVVALELFYVKLKSCDFDNFLTGENGVSDWPEPGRL
jgi:hypothetical protein